MFKVKGHPVSCFNGATFCISVNGVKIPFGPDVIFGRSTLSGHWDKNASCYCAEEQHLDRCFEPSLIHQHLLHMVVLPHRCTSRPNTPTHTPLKFRPTLPSRLLLSLLFLAPALEIYLLCSLIHLLLLLPRRHDENHCSCCQRRYKVG